MAEYTWVSRNDYLTATEMKNNAVIVYQYMLSKGWTINAICGMLGNMQAESGINPGVWENLTPDTSRGWGLVQWTPSTNYTNWAKKNGYKNDDGWGQLKWIDEVTVSVGQWIPTANYHFSFDDFKVSTESVEDCASAFLYNFERPKYDVEQKRRTDAREWYNYLIEIDPDAPIVPDEPTPSTKRKLSKLLLFAVALDND